MLGFVHRLEPSGSNEKGNGVMRKPKRFVPILFVLLTMAVGGLSGYLSGDIGSVYEALTKPPLTPVSYTHLTLPTIRLV